MDSKIRIPEKFKQIREWELIPVSSPSNPPPAVTPNPNLKIRKWPRNAILITPDSMISVIEEKRYPVKVCPFPLFHMLAQIIVYK